MCVTKRYRHTADLNERWADDHGYPIISVTEVHWMGPDVHRWPFFLGYVTDGSLYVRDEGVLLHLPPPAVDILTNISARRAARAAEVAAHA